MSKINFQTYPIKDLTGGLNLEDYKTEIDEKQALVCDNFNFEGNSIINSNSYKEYEIGQEVLLNNGIIRGLNLINNKQYVSYLSGSLIDIAEGYDNMWREDNFILTTYLYYIPAGTVLTAGEVYSITFTGVGTIYTITWSYTVQTGDTIDIIYNDLNTFIYNSPYLVGEIGDIILSGSSTVLNGVFISPFNKSATFNCSLITLSGKIEASAILNNGFNIDLIKSGKDIILTSTSSTAIYYKNFSDFGYFGQYIVGVNAAIGTYYNGKFLYSTGYDNNLYYSKTSGIDTPYLVTQFGGYDGGVQQVGGGDKITGLLIGENGIYVFKENEVYYSTGISDTKTQNPVTLVEEWQFAYVFDKITNTGAKSKYCITNVGQDIFYYDGIDRKIRRLSYEQNLTTLRDTNISDEIGVILDSTLPLSNYQEKLYFSYPNLRFATRITTASTSNNIILTYNVENGGWLRELDKNIKFGVGKYFTKDGVNGKIFEDNYGNTETGTFESKVYTLNGVDSLYKRFGGFDIIGDLIPDNLEAKSIEINILVNGEIVETREITSTTDKLSFRERIDLYYDGQDIQFTISHTGKGKVVISDCYITYKQLPFYQSEFY